MTVDQIEKNMIVLLDPSGEVPIDEWRFVSHKNGCGWRSWSRRISNTVYIFERRQIWQFLLLSLRFCFGPHRRSLKKIYYIQDGMISLLFPPNFAEGYRRFASKHLPPRKSLRERIKSVLPLLLRADRRYLIVREINKYSSNNEQHPLTGFEFMFFSNPSGKLLLSNMNTLLAECGEVVKTTVNPAYEQVMKKEASIVTKLCEKTILRQSIPNILKYVKLGARSYYFEEYLDGRTLRETLRANIDTSCVLGYLEQLDMWFEKYRSSFSEVPISIELLYQHLFTSCRKVHVDNTKLMDYLSNIEKCLSNVSKGHQGLIPIIAHNDLWPGNILVTPKGLIAIDWERATSQRSGVFDYFWMIISTVIEYQIGLNGKENYSTAFRRFILKDSEIYEFATKMLEDFLVSIHINKDFLPLFLGLFLMEWSIQGYLALGNQTDMDQLAYLELLNYTQMKRD